MAESLTRRAVTGYLVSYRLFSEKAGAWEEKAKCKSIYRNPLMKQPHISPGSSPVDTHSNKPILFPPQKTNIYGGRFLQ